LKDKKKKKKKKEREKKATLRRDRSLARKYENTAINFNGKFPLLCNTFRFSSIRNIFKTVANKDVTSTNDKAANTERTNPNISGLLAGTTLLYVGA
jgi:hypothetical protein